MNMKLFEGLNAINGDICTPQGFIVDTFECQFNGLMDSISILFADNPCIVAFKCSNSVGNSVFNLERLQDTKGIAQAIVLNAPLNFWDFAEDVSHQLGLYNENFLLAFISNGIGSNCVELAFQFDICGVICYFGVLKFNNYVFITTDVAITYDMLSCTLNSISYNVNSVDVLCVVASGQAGNMAITKDNYILKVFKDALQCVMNNL